LEEFRAAHEQLVNEAQAEAMAENAGRFAELDKLLEQIDIKLDPFLISTDIDVKNQAADSVLMKFLQRRSQELAFYEYDLAAFEPGLSPGQRQLLFAAAVFRFDLPLAGPEMQPIFAPQTIIPVE
jgi:hypothetical protein